MRLWDVKKRIALSVLSGHTGWVNSVAFSPDGLCLASGSYDNSVRLWDVKTRQCLNTLKLTSIVSTLAFKKAAEKTTLCVGSGKAIYMFDIKCIELRLEFILIGSIGHEAGLKSAQLDLGGVVGLEPHNLLKQREAVGTLSTKETEAVLSTQSHSLSSQTASL